jgi:DNA-binding transcriptional ArsR family regulator
MAIPNHASGDGGTSDIDWTAEGSAIYKALSSPIRRAFLFALAACETLTAGDFAERTGLGLVDVSYHVRELSKAGLIFVSAERPAKRGAKPAKVWRLKDEHLSVLAPQSVLSSIAAQLNRAEGSPYAVIDWIAETVRAAGLPIGLRAEQESALGLAVAA